MTNDALTKVKKWVTLLVWKVTVQKAEQKGNIGGEEDTGVSQGNWLASLWSAPVFVLSPFIHKTRLGIALHRFVSHLYTVRAPFITQQMKENESSIRICMTHVSVPVIPYSF